MSGVVGVMLGSEQAMRIQQCGFGKLVVGGETYTDDLIVLGDRVVPKWWRRSSHMVELEDLTEALAAEPEALIIGTGTQQCLKVAPEVIAHTMKAGIELLVFDTRTACQTFNRLLGKRRIVALLHLTC
ncbi:MAG: Mth938-like domain-containing protein [Armatimonadota bacterium]